MSIFSNFKKFLIFLFLFSTIFNLSVYSQKSTRKSEKKSNKEKISESDKLKNEVVITIGNEKITFADLEKAFRKNMNRKDVKLWEVSRDSLDDFIELYTKYRLKVQDAIQRGFENDSSVIADITQNRRILAESYFLDKKLVDRMVDDMLSKRDRELQIAIILFQFPMGNENDSMAAYLKGKACLELLKQGKDFAEIAKDSSDDKESGERGGVITNYITAGRTQRPIEDAIYKTKPGNYYPELIRTRYGYFIVKVLKSEPRIKVRGSHILLSEGLDKDSLKVIAKADSILNLLKKGADFARLAEENSEDPSSAIKGGDLGAWYSRSSGMENTGRNLLPPFEEALYSLKDGEISGKVYTDYGIHIIKRDSSKAFNIESERDEMKKLYKRIYFETDKRTFLDSVKKSFGFNIFYDVLAELVSSIDTTKTNLDTTWSANINEFLRNKNIFTFNNTAFNVEYLINKMNKQSDLRGFGLNTNDFKVAIDKLSDPLVYDVVSEQLEKEYPDYANLIREFRDGILLFKVEAMEVWDKLKFDSVLARSFWDTTKQKYVTQPVYDISEIYVLSDTLANDLYNKLINGANFSELAKQHTQRAGYREKNGHWGRVTAKDNQLAKIVIEDNLKSGEFSKPHRYDNGYSIVMLNEFEPPRQKTFEEAIPDFAPTFQDLLQKHLSEKWISSLRSKFSVKINKDKLTSIMNSLKKMS